MRQKVFWLLPPFLIYSLAFGGVIVPKLNLILSLICQQYLSDRALRDPTFHFMKVQVGSDNPQCRIPEVQALVTRFSLYVSVITGILSAITSPKLGVLSDRHGRKKVMLLSTMGMLANETITIIAATHPDMVSVNWLLLGAVCDGLCGSFTASMAISYAYASDCTAPPKRVVTFAYFHGCLFTGIALGPLVAGYIIKATGHLITIFYIAIGAHLFYLSCLTFVVPESLSKERQIAAQERKHDVDGAGSAVSWKWTQFGWYIATGGGLFAPLSVMWPTTEGSSHAVRRNLVFLAAVDTIMFGVAMGSMSIVVYYSEYMFGWGNFESSKFVSIVNICRVTCLMIILPIIVRIVRGPSGSASQRNTGSDGLDLAIIRTAVAFDTLGYIGYATVRSGNLFILSGAVAALGGMGSPSLQSALTKHVPPDQTGQLLGAVGLLHALARVISPTIFSLIYGATVGKFTQTVFVCLAGCFGFSFILSWFIKPHGKLHHSR